MIHSYLKLCTGFSLLYKIKLRAGFCDSLPHCLTLLLFSFHYVLNMSYLVMFLCLANSYSSANIQPNIITSEKPFLSGKSGHSLLCVFPIYLSYLQNFIYNGISLLVCSYIYPMRLSIEAAYLFSIASH